MTQRTQEESAKILEDAAIRVRVGGLYEHYKHPDRVYKVLHLGFIKETGEPCVIYESDHGKKFVYVRSLENFLDTVEIGGVRVERFRKL